MPATNIKLSSLKPILLPSTIVLAFNLGRIAVRMSFLVCLIAMVTLSLDNSSPDLKGCEKVLLSISRENPTSSVYNPDVGVNSPQVPLVNMKFVKHINKGGF